MRIPVLMSVANEAKHLILKDYETARVDVLKLDLSINSIKAFVNHFNSLNLPLNILIASVMFFPYQLFEDGIEMQFATNHLGVGNSSYGGMVVTTVIVVEMVCTWVIVVVVVAAAVRGEWW
ncbi:short-chain dehydrogenase TIC 32, chloroplastic-like [Camellia sinensis]|uniref:short-chain dehydrogenase TIC 32, chloroplastic-like n=1 Tax=Camellia sinensis TaxID=4442 RepID=UPI001035767E|nr:short-chain dehydrogenase TIC 32, chloroplastic-like [Camellia sinensis]